MFKVQTGVKGARRVNEKLFDSRSAAETYAAVWGSSNSLGSYGGKITKVSDYIKVSD